ncbi:class I SAM-dependent methyltransferase [bacterium]|nr:class I SAM-dependent methyltransferase [bacterium]
MPLLQRVGEIDIFIHDSEHTYENMLWEYQTAFPFIKPGGILLSDDILCSEAFHDFTKKVKRKGQVLYFFGGLKK